MRWRRQAHLLFGISGTLMAFALGFIVWLFMMDAGANISPDPNGVANRAGTLAQGSEDDAFVKIDWDHWRAINPDIVAWVNVPDTAINYPVVRASADDPTYYLHHDVYRHYSAYGVPYLDADCTSEELQAFNAIIYGHHMDNGSMFSDFANYSDEAYARKHPFVYLQSPTEKQKLAVSFVSIIDASHTPKAIHYEDVTEFRNWFAEQFETGRVALTTDAEPNYAVTFCTCSYHEFGNERTLVVCVPATEVDAST